MSYHFQNLVFEGGGVKGIAYAGAMQVLEEKGILSTIKRVGGTSAGAINAVLVALGYSNKDQLTILNALDFNNFIDDDWGIVRDSARLVKEYGWYKGDFFHTWLSDLIKRKLKNSNATFTDLKDAGLRDLYLYGTNLSTRFGEIFSYEHTPHERIADAARISMSIPLFFSAVRNARNDVYVDGGVLSNYPIQMFDRLKYIEQDHQATMAVATDYYQKVNRPFLKKHPNSSPYTHNRQTLGFRLDSKQQIAAFRDRREPVHYEVDDFFDYIKALVTTIFESQGNQHLHSDDWQRTVYIDTLGVGTTDFDISQKQKDALRKSGRNGTIAYFQWFDNRE
ncbi:MAG: patatin-like phospholipase family protein [Nitrospira sp.]|nr:patatin-like phospholipase family protein [Nitrospira sp.]MDH4245806.1 patatin-like phospholipase family protein [Nitrospira sp.]MDH4357993.1 patatin-like phospholipase family protein [Nitrospira sp.]MDH5320253.1 patatin-like phospholipase family protein [Nitrospira sp.]